MDQRIREGEVAHLRSEQDRLEQRMDDDARLLKELETVAGRAQRSARRAQENAVTMQRIRMLQHTTAAAYQARDLAHLQSHAHAASMLPHQGMLGALPHALGHGIGAGMPLGMVGQEAMLDMQVQERLAALKEQDVRRHNNTALQSVSCWELGTGRIANADSAPHSSRCACRTASPTKHCPCLSVHRTRTG